MTPLKQIDVLALRLISVLDVGLNSALKAFVEQEGPVVTTLVVEHLRSPDAHPVVKDFLTLASLAYKPEEADAQQR